MTGREAVIWLSALTGLAAYGSYYFLYVCASTATRSAS